MHAPRVGKSGCHSVHWGAAVIVIEIQMVTRLVCCAVGGRESGGQHEMVVIRVIGPLRIGHNHHEMPRLTVLLYPPEIGTRKLRGCLVVVELCRSQSKRCQYLLSVDGDVCVTFARSRLGTQPLH